MLKSVKRLAKECEQLRVILDQKSSRKVKVGILL